MNLKFIIDENYIQRMHNNQKQANLEELQYIVPIENIKDCNVMVDFRDEVMILHYFGKDSKDEKYIPYMNIYRVMEFQDGILLVLTKYKAFFLPVGKEIEYNKLLLEAFDWLRMKSPVKLKKYQNLHCEGLAKLDHIKFRIRMLFLENGAKESKWKLILFSILCLLMGTIFMWNTTLYNKVDPSDTTYISDTYEHCRLKGRKLWRNSQYMYIYLAEEKRIEIHYSCLSDDLIEEIYAIETGAEVEARIHPNNDYVIELIVEGKELLNFEESQDVMKKDMAGFKHLAIVMYVLPVIAIIDTKVKERKYVK